MANKKSQIKKNTKQTKKTNEPIDTSSLKDIFVAEAQNTTFTEEDVEELKNTKVEEAPVEDAVSIETVDGETDKIDETVATEEEEISEEVQPIGDKIDEQSEKEDTIQVDEVETSVEISEKTVNEEVKKERPKKRITTKEAYGYHWMGLIYDE